MQKLLPIRPIFPFPIDLHLALVFETIPNIYSVFLSHKVDLFPKPRLFSLLFGNNESALIVHFDVNSRRPELQLEPPRFQSGRVLGAGAERNLAKLADRVQGKSLGEFPQLNVQPLAVSFRINFRAELRGKLHPAFGVDRSIISP